jgi:ribosomal protein S18 acetylase RimI-like enzyme
MPEMPGAPPDLLVRQASPVDAVLAAPLFALYRQFYGQPYDESMAADFLRERLERGQSVVLLAEVPGSPPMGFTQLYPGFSSVAAAPAWVLGDLYVREWARGGGVAAALMEHAERIARQAGAVHLTLETARDNLGAQRLYERQGYRVVDRFLMYEKPLT